MWTGRKPIDSCCSHLERTIMINHNQEKVTWPQREGCQTKGQKSGLSSNFYFGTIHFKTFEKYLYCPHLVQVPQPPPCTPRLSKPPSATAWHHCADYHIFLPTSWIGQNIIISQTRIVRVPDTSSVSLISLVLLSLSPLILWMHTIIPLHSFEPTCRWLKSDWMWIYSMIYWNISISKDQFSWTTWTCWHGMARTRSGCPGRTPPSPLPPTSSLTLVICPSDLPLNPPTSTSDLWTPPLQALVVLDYKLIIDRRTPADV